MMKENLYVRQLVIKLKLANPPMVVYFVRTLSTRFGTTKMAMISITKHR